MYMVEEPFRACAQSKDDIKQTKTTWLTKIGGGKCAPSVQWPRPKLKKFLKYNSPRGGWTRRAGHISVDG